MIARGLMSKVAKTRPYVNPVKQQPIITMSDIFTDAATADLASAFNRLDDKKLQQIINFTGDRTDAMQLLHTYQREFNNFTYISDIAYYLKLVMLVGLYAIILKKQELAEEVKDLLTNAYMLDMDKIKQIMKNTLDKLGNVILNKINEASQVSEQLEESKRVVKRYYIRPQNKFCSNKEEILKALVEIGDENCSVYTLRALDDHDDVHLLTPQDIIYYYDDGILYDKNHVKVMDYDLFVKNEENRKKFGNVDTVSDTAFDNAYEDRLTEDIFSQDFESFNAYGESVDKPAYICCLCGEEFTGYGNNPFPVAESGRCCDACNRHYVIPARVSMMRDRREQI